MHLGILSAGIEDGVNDLDLQGLLADSNSSERCSTLLFHTDLGWLVLYIPIVLLFEIRFELILFWFQETNFTKGLTHQDQDKMAAISQTTISNTFSWMKMLEFQLKFHWSL